MRIALSAYFGMVSFLDHNIGQLLEVLDATGLDANTRVVYTSDHGDNLGNRGLWGKSMMYEESVAVPLIMAGKGIPAGPRRGDAGIAGRSHPTFIEALGDPTAARTTAARPLAVRHHRWRGARPGRAERVSCRRLEAGTYMLRQGRWKYVHYVGHAPQLFDLEADPASA